MIIKLFTRFTITYETFLSDQSWPVWLVSSRELYFSHFSEPPQTYTKTCLETEPSRGPLSAIYCLLRPLSLWRLDHCPATNPGRFAHFPVRPWVVSPTFPFAPSRFAAGSFRPLSRSPLSRFAHFPVRPWVVSPPYKILFLVLSFRPQKWYKALIFLLIGDFSLYRIRDGKKSNEHFIRYFEK